MLILLALRLEPHDIELAREADLVSIAESQGVRVRRRGDGYWGLCPFHTERTASFQIRPDLGQYRCFSCGASGDAIGLAQALRGDSFVQAVDWLASSKRGRRRAPVASDKTDLARGVAAAAEYYAKELATREGWGGVARTYLRRRGISPKIAREFGIGVAPPNSRPPGGSGRDKFAGRLMMPIRDARGQALGFGSRALVRDARVKYVNSPTSALFSKRDVLFGLDLAAPHIACRDEVVLVEGYFDVLALHDVDLRNVVGVLGVAVTPSQIELAARFCDSRRVVLALDADKAGDGAIDRLCDHVFPALSRDVGVDIRVAAVPDNCKDAADFVAMHKLRGTKDIAARFQKYAVDIAVPWTQRHLQDVFRPG